MGTLVWSTELATGISEIDNQHKRIVHYINQLDDVRRLNDRAGLQHVIAELVDYALSHFAFEEELMECAGYSFAGPHKKVHQLFTRKVAELKSRFDAGEDVGEALHAMLSRWLFSHILNEDRGYIDAVNAYLRSVAKPDAAAPTTGALAALQKPQKRGWFARLFGG